jgi:hypothetical protein
MAYMREEDEIKVVDDALQFMGVARPDRAGVDMLDFNTLVPIFFDIFHPPEVADYGGS